MRCCLCQSNKAPHAGRSHARQLTGRHAALGAPPALALRGQLFDADLINRSPSFGAIPPEWSETGAEHCR
jgi:hypothetical protein